MEGKRREARTHPPPACPCSSPHPFPNANRQVTRCRAVNLDGNYIDYDYDPRSAKLSEQERRNRFAGRKSEIVSKVRRDEFIVRSSVQLKLSGSISSQQANPYPSYAVPPFTRQSIDHESLQADPHADNCNYLQSFRRRNKSLLSLDAPFRISLVILITIALFRQPLTGSCYLFI